MSAYAFPWENYNQYKSSDREDYAVEPPRPYLTYMKSLVQIIVYDGTEMSQYFIIFESHFFSCDIESVFYEFWQNFFEGNRYAI